MEANYMKVAQSWLEGNFDQQTKDEVKKLMDTDPVALEDAFYRNLEFGTGGLRGVMGVGTNRMNKYVVGMATQGLANYIKQNVKGEGLNVSISYDSRNHSQEFAQISAEILAANGLDVYLFESLRPTPELSYAIRANKSIAGIMVTASHNPAEYNGYKVFWEGGAQITSPVDKDIVAEVGKITDPSMILYTAPEGAKAGKITMMGADMDEKYISDILTLMLTPEARAKHTDLKLVYTPLHGTGVHIVPECLKRLGFTNVYHVPAQDVNDGNFPTVMSPNPEEPSALKMALEVADKEGADIVLATDPDADRMGIAVRDNEGKMVLLNGNQTASIMTYYILRRWKELGKLDGTENYIVKTIVTTELLRDIASSFGAKCYNVLTGFKYIAEVVRNNEGKSKFICGGEESYGFNVGEFVRDKDAPIACSMVAEAAAWALEQGMTLYQLLQQIYKEYGYRKESLISVVRKGKSGAEEIAQIMTDYRQNPPAEIAGSPVVKVVDYLKTEETGLPKSNVLQFFSKDGDVVSVRPSGTEPKIKFYFGAAGDTADAKIEALRAQFGK
ncbi:MAG: phospho-sugar mutase [Bacteroidales bacterium]|nr:phospho-sugar mutase [Bacteroidales bacterium]